MTTHNLLVELFVEELPPKALRKLGEAFASQLFEQLKAQGLTATGSQLTSYASPRRLAAHITQVTKKAADRPLSQKLMPVSVGLDSDGNPTPALTKKIQSVSLDLSIDSIGWAVLETRIGGKTQIKDLGVRVFDTNQSSESHAQKITAYLVKRAEGKADAIYLETTASGVTLKVGLQKALHEAITHMPIPKVMTYQLQQGTPLPGWDSVQFVRPAHGLLALHGADVVPVTALGLAAGRATHGHRFEAAPGPIEITHADAYADTLREQGAVIASFDERRALIESQLKAVAAQAGQALHAIEDEALLDEVTALVERPKVLLCQFDPQFLAVPQECLILTMKANQKYFPLLDGAGKLTHQFLVVSNISPPDASAVIQGNERVVRPRLQDAQFFFDQDRKKPLESRVPQLAKVVYHNKLGTQGERTERVRAIAHAIGAQLGGQALAQQAEQAARLAKADLLSDMVGEFPELQGVMGRYYALHDGLPPEVADAIEDHYKPRFAGDTLPRGEVGTVVALADKLETLVGMFGIGNVPTGDRDPFALRRHALGVIRIVVERELPLDLSGLTAAAALGFRSMGVSNEILQSLYQFVYDRFAGLLRDQGFSAQEIDAVLSQNPERLMEVPKRLQAVRAFAQLPEAPALAAANKRIGNILKKAELTPGAVDATLLRERAEQALHAAMQAVLPQADRQFSAGDYTASLQSLAALRAPVDAFFDGVMVNADDAALKANRLHLLHQLHQTMNRVADLSRLAA